MRVPILVLCLVVVYGSCRIYAQESTDFIKEEKNGDYYVSNFETVHLPFEKSLSRNKRTITLLTTVGGKLANLALNTFKNVVLQPTLDALLVFTGLKNCSKVESLSFNCALIENILGHPIQTAKTMICYAINVVGSPSRNLIGPLISKGFENFITFTRKTLLPLGCWAVDQPAAKLIPSASVQTAIPMISMACKFAKITGMIG